jgi:hypothetical protein
MNFSMTFPRPIHRPIAAFLICVTSLQADSLVLLDEAFTAADRTLQNLPVSTGWFSATDSGHVAHDPTAGNLTLYSAEASSRHIIAYFTDGADGPVELQPGETLQVAYTVTFTNPDPNTESPRGNSFRVGLFNANLQGSGVGRIDADNLGGVSTVNTPSRFHTYVGYRFDTILHTNTNSPQVRVYRRGSGYDGSALMAVSTAYSGALAASTHSLRLFPAGLYHGVADITRTTSGALRLQHRLTAADTGNTIDVAVDGADGSAAAVSSFDTLAFCLNSRVAESFTLHHVTITRMAASGSTAVEIQVGPRSFTTDQYTLKGAPVVPMWQAPMPTANTADAAGFPVLAEAEHAYVWQPATREAGAFNHFSALAHYRGRFFAMWGNHPDGETGPGQRTMYAWSDAWGEWSEAFDLFPPPGPVKPRNQSGIHCKPDRWMVVDDILYAVVYMDGAGRYPVARSVAMDGTLGEPFLVRTLPEGATLPVYMQGYVHTTERAQLALRLRSWYILNSQVSWWAYSGEGVPRTGIFGADLIEPFTYRARDGGYVLLSRYWGHSGNPVHDNRMYVSFSNSPSGWAAPYPTDIPDSPSRAEAVTLADGTVLLIGNQIAYRYDTALYLDRDPITVSLSDDGLVFDRVYALRANAPKFYRFSGVSGRNFGYAYSSSLVHQGWLYTLYSIGKEDVGISRVPLTALGVFINDANALRADAEELGEGWWHAPWLGPFWNGAQPYVYTPHLGWLYVHSHVDGLLYVWHPELGWAYTGPGLFPHFHVFATAAWHWFTGTEFVPMAPATSAGPAAAVLDLALEPAFINTDPGPEYAAEVLDYAMVIGLDRTPGGRLWAAWVAGGDNDKGLFVTATSDNGGDTWSAPRLVIDPTNSPSGLRRRTLVGNFWTDPTGRLWLFYDQALSYFDGRAGAWAITCDNPDDAQPLWSEPRRIWHGATLNKPLVLGNGEWLLPISLWTRDWIRIEGGFPELDHLRMAHVFVSTDQGASWQWRGAAAADQRRFDEHTMVELRDGRLWMLIRTFYGIAESYSSDQGRTWSKPEPSRFKHVERGARVFFRRLASGRLLLVKHGAIDQQTTTRSLLAAFLSEDDGATWIGGLLLDARTGVSYPDGFEGPDGRIHIIYDRNRAADREILLARFTEADILAGGLVTPGSSLRTLVHKALGGL